MPTFIKKNAASIIIVLILIIIILAILLITNVGIGKIDKELYQLH